MKVLLHLEPMDPDWRAMQPVIEKDPALRSDVTLVVSQEGRPEGGEVKCDFVHGEHVLRTRRASCWGIQNKRALMDYLTANFAT